MYLNTQTQYYNNQLHVGSIIPLKSKLYYDEKKKIRRDDITGLGSPGFFPLHPVIAAGPKNKGGPDRSGMVRDG